VILLTNKQTNKVTTQVTEDNTSRTFDLAQQQYYIELFMLTLALTVDNTIQ